MIVPLLVGLASTSSNVCCGESAGNSRLRPPPATTGLIISVSSSIRPSSTRDRTSDGLPAVPIAPPGCSRSSRTKSAAEPLISVLLDQPSTESSVLDATYFGVLLIQLANGSPGEGGQYFTHSLNVTRPSSTASCSASMADSASPISSSKAVCHWSRDSTTPSIVLN